MKTTVIHHSADFDGLFCREIARKFLPEAELIGWDYGDELLEFPSEGKVYVLDLNPNCFVSLDISELERICWIDHHKTAIEKWSGAISGYRIDGVAACRLAWAWFTHHEKERDEVLPLPDKAAFIHDNVEEPIAVRLAGLYDVWDKRESLAEQFQFGLRSQCLAVIWPSLLSFGQLAEKAVYHLLSQGEPIRYARIQEYKQVIQEQGFDVKLEGLTFLACCSHGADIRSALFEAGIQPHHEGLLGFTWTGKLWRVSLYGIPGKEHDLSKIASKYGGGGHRHACGFQVAELPFLLKA